MDRVVTPERIPEALLEKARGIRLLLTDCDGVLTNGGIYYSAEGEALKRFSARDGMGVERLKNKAGIDVGIVTGENSAAVACRAAKLNLEELHLEARDKASVFREILERRKLEPFQVAYIGDDVNDVEVMALAGLSACPVDAVDEARDAADYICRHAGGYGAFREFAELIISAVQER